MQFLSGVQLRPVEARTRRKAKTRLPGSEGSALMLLDLHAEYAKSGSRL